MREGLEEATVPARATAPEPPGRGRLDELYRRHALDAVRLAYLLTGDAQVAQDLAEHAFVRLGWRLVHLRRADAFGAYLRKTVVNPARAHFRRRRGERAAAIRGIATRVATEPDVADREAVRRALRLLPARQRIAVVLRFYEDPSYREIADVMRCRGGTVGSLLCRGHKDAPIGDGGRTRCRRNLNRVSGWRSSGCLERSPRTPRSRRRCGEE
jgi:RNA polymerase sigma factor (sigma-70 family)